MATYDIKQIALPGGDIVNLKDGNAIHKSNTSGFVKNDGSIDQNTYQIAQEGKGLSTNDYTDTDKSKVGKIDTTTTSISGNPISISGLKANQLAKNPIITFEPIQSGSGTPSPSNVRAISGYDKIEVLSCGKNLFGGKYNELYEMPVYIPKGTSIVASVKQHENPVTVVSYYREDGTKIDYWAVSVASSTTQNRLKRVFTLSEDVYYFKFDTASCEDMQIEIGSEDTSYVPYVKTTSISESLGQTVYGGTWYPRTGKLGNIYQYYEFDGSSDESWSMPAAGVFMITLSVAAKDIKAPICNEFEGKTVGGWGDLGNNQCAFHPFTKTTFRINCGSITTLADWQTALGNTPVQLVYEKATPTEIQLTPHEISLLKDYAYVSTNGTNIALDYHNGELASLSDVSQLGETVNELEDKVSANDAGTQVNLMTYNTSTNKYVCPSDGYITLSNAGSAVGDYIIISVYGANDNTICGLRCDTPIANMVTVQNLFVKRGMKCYIRATSSTGSFAALFTPLA